MAKNKTTRSMNYAPTDYAQQQENIRKAKGNPNKNIHQKKNGSNYGGYASAVKKQTERQTGYERKRESIFEMNRTQRIIFIISLVLAAAGVILSSTAFKDTDAAKFLPSVAMGIPCCVMAYIGFSNRDKKRTGFQTIVLVLLAFCGLYALVGLLGLLGVLKLSA